MKIKLIVIALAVPLAFHLKDVSFAQPDLGYTCPATPDYSSDSKAINVFGNLPRALKQQWGQPKDRDHGFTAQKTMKCFYEAGPQV
jgi:hypothetical protein